LLARLDAGPRYRVGLVAFSDQAHVLAKVGSSPAELERAQRALLSQFPRYLRGTNFGDAVATAQLALQPESNGAALGPPAGTAQSILLLSDGAPTLPPHGDRARQHALYAATAAGAAGIRLFTFDLSRDATGSSSVLAEMASRSGGRFERLERPGDAIARLRRTDLSGLDQVRVVNETNGAPARALRTFPDGSFDGFVEVAPGRNRIVFRATTTDGRSAEAERIVVRTGSGDAAALVRELRKRTRETELWAEMERERRTQKLVGRPKRGSSSSAALASAAAISPSASSDRSRSVASRSALPAISRQAIAAISTLRRRRRIALASVSGRPPRSSDATTSAASIGAGSSSRANSASVWRCSVSSTKSLTASTRAADSPDASGSSPGRSAIRSAALR
jgi:hypothetical protein